MKVSNVQVSIKHRNHQDHAHVSLFPAFFFVSILIIEIFSNINLPILELDNFPYNWHNRRFQNKSFAYYYSLSRVQWIVDFPSWAQCLLGTLSLFQRREIIMTNLNMNYKERRKKKSPFPSTPSRLPRWVCPYKLDYWVTN